MLQKEHVEIMLPFLSDKTTEDIFHEMIAICYEAEGANHKVRCAKAKREIIEYLKAQKKEKQTLYNEHRNISFNQSYGENGTPVSEWLDTSGWDEWDR